MKSISGPTIRALLWPTWRNPEYTACSATSTLPRDPRWEAPLQTFGILPRGRRLYPTHNPSVRIERVRPEPTSPRSTPPSRSEATGALVHRPPFEMDMRQESPRHGGIFPDRGGRTYPRKRHMLPVYHRPGQLNHRSQRKRKGPNGQTAVALRLRSTTATRFSLPEPCRPKDQAAKTDDQASRANFRSSRSSLMSSPAS